MDNIENINNNYTYSKVLIKTNNLCFNVGNNYDGCLFNGTLDDQEKPIIIDFFKELSKLTYNINYDKINFITGLRCCALYNKERVFLFGKLIITSIITQNNNEFVYNNSFCSFNISTLKIKIKNIALGMHHILILSEEGNIYAQGKQVKGELGLGENIEFASSFNKVKVNDIIINIYCNTKQSYCINENFEVYSWGSNRYYELGHIEKEVYYYPNKVLINNIYKTKSVLLGLKYALFISNNLDCIYFTGDNKKSVIFNENKSKIYLKQYNLKNLIDDSFKHFCYNINIEENLIKVIDIKSGWNNIYININYNKTSCILCYGENNLNQLINSSYINKNISIYNHNCYIVKLIVGTDFSYFIDENHNIYSFGWNEHYNLCSLDNLQKNKLIKIDLSNFDFYSQNNNNDDNKYEIEDICLGGAYTYFIFKKKFNS